MAKKQPERYIGETEKNLSRLQEGELDEWITTAEAAQISGYHLNHVRRLLKAGDLQGRKWGSAWMVNRKSLNNYLYKMGEKGGKRGPKTTQN